MSDQTTKSASNADVKLPTVKELLEAGVHFGHETKRWNPAFGDYIFTKRGKFHIIDLEKTLDKLEIALNFLIKAASEGDILIVGTKRQAREIVKEEATRCGAHFVINRWIGGQVTNFDRIAKSIRKLRSIEEKLDGDISEYNQQQLSVLRREWARLDRLFGGVKQLEKIPSAVVLIDALYEKIPLRELSVANVPVIALVDSNTDPAGLEYPVPGNDDAIKSVKLFMRFFADAILAGNKGNGIKHFFKDFSTVGIKAEDLKESKEEKKVSTSMTHKKSEEEVVKPEKETVKEEAGKPIAKTTKKATAKSAPVEKGVRESRKKAVKKVVKAKVAAKKTVKKVKKTKKASSSKKTAVKKETKGKSKK
ncbi:MAG: 30S ribosomal protein S2 [Patescibacteria group bacterium]|nr:30S ribosomal protein S2 [Patescibacteria group bacterium]